MLSICAAVSFKLIPLSLYFMILIMLLIHYRIQAYFFCVKYMYLSRDHGASFILHYIFAFLIMLYIIDAFITPPRCWEILHVLLLDSDTNCCLLLEVSGIVSILCF